MSSDYKLPVLSYEECLKVLAKIGYSYSRNKSCHIWCTCEGRSGVSVPTHKELSPGTLRNIIRNTGLSILEFKKYVGK